MARNEPDKRTRILLAAVHVFSDQGYHNAKIEGIAIQAEVGKGTVYEYFSSKHQLFLEMLIYSHDQYREFVQQSVHREETAVGKLRELIRCHLTFMQESGCIARIILRERIDEDGTLHQWLLEERRKQIEFVEQILAAARDKGELRIESTELITLAIIGAISTVGHLFFIEGKPLDVDALTTVLMNAFLHGIAPQA